MLFRSIPIIACAKRGNEVQVEELLRMKHKVDRCDTMGNSSLMWAAAGGHLDTCKVLVRWKANIDLQNKAGDTALHKSTWKNHSHVVQYLLGLGANRDLVNSEGKQALDLAKVKATRSLLMPPIEFDDDDFDEEDSEYSDDSD